MQRKAERGCLPLLAIEQQLCARRTSVRTPGPRAKSTTFGSSWSTTSPGPRSRSRRSLTAKIPLTKMEQAAVTPAVQSSDAVLDELVGGFIEVDAVVTTARHVMARQSLGTWAA